MTNQRALRIGCAVAIASMLVSPYMTFLAIRHARAAQTSPDSQVRGFADTNPTRPPRGTRPPNTPLQPDYSLAIDKPMAIEEFHGHYCEYFEMQLHAHRKSTGEDFTQNASWSLQNGGSTLTVDANGLMKGNAQPPPDQKCGDEFVLRVDPLDTVPPALPASAAPLASNVRAVQPMTPAPTVTLPTAEMKAKAAAVQKKIDGQ